MQIVPSTGKVRKLYLIFKVHKECAQDKLNIAFDSAWEYDSKDYHMFFTIQNTKKKCNNICISFNVFSTAIREQGIIRYIPFFNFVLIALDSVFFDSIFENSILSCKYSYKDWENVFEHSNYYYRRTEYNDILHFPAT